MAQQRRQQRNKRYWSECDTMRQDDYFHAQYASGQGQGHIIPMVLERIKAMVQRSGESVETLTGILEHDGLPVVRLRGFKGELLRRMLGVIGLHHSLLLPGQLTQDTHGWRYPLAVRLCRASGLMDIALSAEDGLLVLPQPKNNGQGLHGLVLHATHWMNARLGLPGYTYASQKALSRYLCWQQQGRDMQELAKAPADVLQALMPALQRHSEALGVLATICEEVLSPDREARESLSRDK